MVNGDHEAPCAKTANARASEKTRGGVSYQTRTKPMTDEQNSGAVPVTPEELKEKAAFNGHMLATYDSCMYHCPACALNKAAEALREAQKQTVASNQDAHIYAQQVRALKANYDSVDRVLGREIEKNARLAEENRRLRAKINHHYRRAMRKDSDHRCPWRQGLEAVRDSALSTKPEEN